MREIRFHGRGGQGAVLAAKILAKALVQEGKYIKAVPSFGIRQTTNIYHPDWIVCIDPTLFRTVDIFEGIKDGGVLVQATAKDVKELSIPKLIKKVGLCNAFHISLEVFGRSITNTIMLGALLKTTHVVSLDSLSQALEEGGRFSRCGAGEKHRSGPSGL